MARVSKYVCIGEEAEILFKNGDEVFIRDDDATRLLLGQSSGQPCRTCPAEAGGKKKASVVKLLKESL